MTKFFDDENDKLPLLLVAVCVAVIAASLCGCVQGRMPVFVAQNDEGATLPVPQDNAEITPAASLNVAPTAGATLFELLGAEDEVVFKLGHEINRGGGSVSIPAGAGVRWKLSPAGGRFRFIAPRPVVKLPWLASTCINDLDVDGNQATAHMDIGSQTFSIRP